MDWSWDLIIIQAHKRWRKTLFIMTKYDIQIFGVSLFLKLQNNTSATLIR